MKVIDIILNEALVNTPNAVAKANAIVARIDSFLNPADPNRVQILDPEPRISKHALTAEKLDADTTGEITKKLGEVKDAIDNSIKANDGKLSTITKDYNAWLKRREDVSIKAAISYVNPIDVYNTNVKLINQLLTSTNDTPVKLSANKGYATSLSWLSKAHIQNLTTYINTGANLVQQINNQIPQTVDDPLAELDSLNQDYHLRILKNLQDGIKRKYQTRGLEAPKSEVNFLSISEMKQLGIDIVKFLKLPNDSTERLVKEIDFNRSNVKPSDIDTLNDFVNEISKLDSNDSTHYRIASRLKARVMEFLTRRQGAVHNAENPTTTFAANRHGQGKIQQLGNLPSDFIKGNPLHETWRKLIEGALLAADRREVTDLYIDYWKIITAQSWNCYLTNIPMVANAEYDEKAEKDDPYLISIDRIDSTLDYTVNNVAFCCNQVNTIKGNLLNNELVAMCKQILKYNGLLTNQNQQVVESKTRFEYKDENASPRNWTKQQWLESKRDKVKAVYENYNQVLFSYEVRQLQQIYSVFDKEINKPTTLEFANFLLNAPELKWLNIKSKAVARAKNYPDPIEMLLKGLQEPTRYRLMTYADFKNDVMRVATARPKLKKQLSNLLNYGHSYFQDQESMGDQTINNKHGEKLSDTLLLKYRAYRTKERAGDTTDRYKATATKDQLINMAKTQRGKCAITGIPFSSTKGAPDRVSLDRIDSQTGGYSAKNIQLVLRRVNIMKNELSTQDFLYWCLQIYNNAGIEVTDTDLKAAVLRPILHDNDEEVNDETDNSKELD